MHAETHAIPASGPIAATLVDTARRLGAKLIVMGLFGRSRLRELLLGGVSRAMLDNSTLPLLLAH
ncbi:universal stress protein [Novosphingobium pokkalii]|uniref:universal stress protein n=1 Tax=Novosphingobium pokkalii TaxID=1770194 RepID=UPI003638D6C5